MRASSSNKTRQVVIIPANGKAPYLVAAPDNAIWAGLTGEKEKMCDFHAALYLPGEDYFDPKCYRLGMFGYPEHGHPDKGTYNKVATKIMRFKPGYTANRNRVPFTGPAVLYADEQDMTAAIWKEIQDAVRNNDKVDHDALKAVDPMAVAHMLYSRDISEFDPANIPAPVDWANSSARP